MFIERIQVEGGFLDGLDLRLRPGLNVLIGARGTGKTSIIELVRFCFGLEGFTPESQQRSIDHASGLLVDGRVRISLRDDGQSRLIERIGGAPFTGEPIRPSPIIFTQTEIESVGLVAEARLRMLDGFRVERASRAATSVASLLAVSNDILSIDKEISSIRERLASLPSVVKRLGELRESEEKTQKNASVTKGRERLERIAQSATELKAVTRFLEETQQSIESLIESVSGLADWSLPEWSSDTQPNPIASQEGDLRQLRKGLRDTASAAGKIRTQLEAQLEKRSIERAKLDEEARILRKELDKFQEGAGATQREIARLTEVKSELDQLQRGLTERQKRADTLRSRRIVMVDSLESERERVSERRAESADALNVRLNPRIRVQLNQSGELSEYSSAIATALRGSGLRYNDLAESLSSTISPSELVSIVDARDSERLAASAGISIDRATKIVAHLADRSMGEILTSRIEDSVDFLLLDGADYKAQNALSTGQRCTVVLPIVLEHTDRILVLDQPEDHIDNAFIAETLISSLNRRPKNSQILISTHNANIPVLASADLVVHMSSDGKRGFPLFADSLSSTNAIEAICTVMEGGREAFAKRASFYRDEQSDT